jgi:deoxyinosine 3'endonuclease (endonuclease V)
MSRDELTEEQLVTREEWRREQTQLKQQLRDTDPQGWSPNDIKYIAGVDISFFKDNEVDAVSSLIVMSYPDFNVVYEAYKFVQLTLPYIPHFLGFREVSHLLDLLNELKEKSPQFYPDMILVDGNGMLHPLGFGVACHLGVLADVATIGVAKKLLFMDGITREKVNQWKNAHLNKGGDSYKLVGDSGQVHGAILRGTDDAGQPIFVSVGHKVSLDTALEVVKKSCLYRIPEPIRQADLRSRDVVRNVLKKEQGEQKQKQGKNAQE